MFIGIQDSKPAFIGETREELENLPSVVLDEIQEVDFAEMYNGIIYLSEEDLVEAQKEFVRKIRNTYLEKYVDGAVSNPLRWADMDQELKDMYTNYRRYLLDYTETDNWWDQLPKTLDEWNNE